ncbi:MAG: queuosine precursor transporter [Clostridiaceae bacterium]|nr:queuosine precursor transporter [Clostridiaceae bacterium]NBH79692.1 VUT family protein [Clostridiaceae bacterium]NBI84268.1 VUT family protein [Clostridiaceae bacterium]
MNELILLISLAGIFGCVLLTLRVFGRTGLYVFSAIATILANIEVMILVDAFGMEMTLGNILFASTFLVTDILSELYGKKSAQKAVNLGIAGSVFFLLVSQSWLLYLPSASDWAMPSMRALFTNTPRLLLASLLVYALAQTFDVWLYHRWWAFTTQRFGDSDRFLWVRNNGSTLVSQLLNTLLYSIFAFAGVYPLNTLISIVLSSYIIFVFTSLADTPVIYAARHLKRRGLIADAKDSN